MRRCADGSRRGTTQPSTCWSRATRAGRIAWPGRSCATPRTPATSRRRPSSASGRRPIASAATPGSRRGSTGSWLTSVWTTSAAGAGGRLVARDEGRDADASLVERQPAPGPDPGDQVSEAQTMARLWDAVHRLSPQQRTAVILHAQEQLSTEEIAEVLKVAEPTVRVHLHRAVTALRRELAP